MDSRANAEMLLNKYYKTFEYPFTHHQINSYDQCIASDIPAIIKASNPILQFQGKIGNTDEYAYKVEIFIGGLDGDQFYIGTPSISLKQNEEIRCLYPNEARLRNLSYSSSVEVDITIRITFTRPEGNTLKQTVVLFDPKDEAYKYLAKIPIFQIPIMLHSRYCLLHDKPNIFLTQVGECPYDYGGYFIIDGAEKVLITRQEQAFNTLYITKQEKDPKIDIYASIQCLNPKTREIKRVAFFFLNAKNTIEVSIPFVRKPIPVFVLFRALGVQTDKDIINLIFPNPDAIESKILGPILHESLLDAYPFVDTYSAIQYMKTLTKGFSEAHIYDILYNQTFIHVENKPLNKALYLAECVRKILRVQQNIDTSTDRDDIRNQRCLTSGFLLRMLFQSTYTKWVKAVSLSIDKEYKYNTTIYEGENFLNIFLPGNIKTIFQLDFITAGLNRGFKGKWSSGVGEEKTGVLQPLSRLSYLDFLSHCRRVVLDFDTGMKLQGPRRLHTSQFGYFCAFETPGGSSIGITKNLSVLTAISLSMDPVIFTEWLHSKMNIYQANDLTLSMMQAAVPVYINSGIVGFSLRPQVLVEICKRMKHTGCLPAYSSIIFNIRERKVSFQFDEGRPVRPLVLIKGGVYPNIDKTKSWRDLVMGSLESTKDLTLPSVTFRDPLINKEKASYEDYIKYLETYEGVIEYIDPYEGNESYIAMYPANITKETSHCEIHPSTMIGIVSSMIPFPNHNQSVRNQLSCSQSKQGLSIYSTNYKNRFDNQTHILCYGEAPLVRTLYYDYVADGQIGYGHNLILAIGSFTGYNQEDGIVFNADSISRGMFRNITYRSYEGFEEDDEKAHTKTRIGNPANIPSWLNIKPGLDYKKLDERGIVKKGAYVDENTVLIGRYIEGNNNIKDASITAQVWTSGIVEEVSVTINNKGLALVKIRVIQDRVPELGDKFSNRHGQKGTIGMLVKGVDMPRNSQGIAPDMMMNPHAIPSRMTIAQLLESLLGKVSPYTGTIGDSTAFMNESNIEEDIGKVLQSFDLHKYGEEILYDGSSGSMIHSSIFVGNCYTMRLKHMVEDKWNARGQGRREQRTHQPTGGRGNQGGLRIGEMERDALLGHGITSFLQESYMKRSDGTVISVCNGCGTIPIYNDKTKLYICSLCDGPVQFVGESAKNFEILPTLKRSTATFSKVEIPYSLEVLNKELNTYMNMGIRYLTTKDVAHIKRTENRGLNEKEINDLISMELKAPILAEAKQPEIRIEEPMQTITDEQKEMLGDATFDKAPQEEIVEQEPIPQLTITQAKSIVDDLMDKTIAEQEANEVNEVGSIQSLAISDPTPQIQQQMQQQIQQQTPTQYVLTPIPPAPIGAQIIQSQIPNAQPILAIDTSPQAMNQQGLRTIQQEMVQPRSILKNSNSTSRFRSKSPSSNRSNTSLSVNKLDSGISDASDVPTHTKINIVKEGS